MTLTRFFFIFSQLFFLTTCESCKNKSVSDLCQTVYTTYIVFTNDICHIMKHLTHNTHILYFLFHNVSFPLLSYTIFYLCPYWDWSPFSGYPLCYPIEVPFVLFCACKVSTLSKISQRKLTLSLCFSIKFWPASIRLTRINPAIWHISTHACLYINIL